MKLWLIFPVGEFTQSTEWDGRSRQKLFLLLQMSINSDSEEEEKKVAPKVRIIFNLVIISGWNSDEWCHILAIF